MPKSESIQNNFTSGEIAPSALGRFDLSKYANSAKIMENFLPKQLGGAMFRPGTRFVAETKTSSLRSRLLRFIFSATQAYLIEAGNLYFRYYIDEGRLGGGSPVELTTVFTTVVLDKIKYAQNTDTQYIVSGTFPVQKHQRTSATTFTIEEVAFVRGPFLDTNITELTITPSADAGTGITLTASSALFSTGTDHVNSLWRVKEGVVKITSVTSTTVAIGDVQAEPDGVAGALGTSTSAVTDWAEGSWSGKRGYPQSVTFHEGRLYFANTSHQQDGLWGSVPFAYENFNKGDAEDDKAVNVELNADTFVEIRWLSSGAKNMQAGTTGGIFSITSGTNQVPITPANINAFRENPFPTADIQARRLYNHVYYVQNDLKRFLESGFAFDIDQNDIFDTTLLADHILQVEIQNSIFFRGDNLSGGAFDLDAQQSPNNRIWIIRNDGQIVVLTRNVREKVNGWCHITAGKTVSCDGKSGTGQFESIAIIPQDGDSDQIWVITNRIIDGTTKRFVEFFTTEEIKYEWEPVRLDSSLTLDTPLTITGISLTNPVVVTAVAHGFSNGDQIRLDNIVGTHQLNGRKFLIANKTADTFELSSEVT